MMASMPLYGTANVDCSKRSSAADQHNAVRTQVRSNWKFRSVRSLYIVYSPLGAMGLVSKAYRVRGGGVCSWRYDFIENSLCLCTSTNRIVYPSKMQTTGP
jgi:hypothetical protein